VAGAARAGAAPATANDPAAAQARAVTMIVRDADLRQCLTSFDPFKTLPISN
jgi:hypothetical protein